MPLVVWTLVRLFGLDSGFPLVPLMAFTPYAAIAALLVAGVATALRNWAAAAATALATLCLAAAVLPRAIGDGTVDPDGRETLVVLSANIHHGTADPAAVVDLVDRYEADLLSVQELTPTFARELRAAGLAIRLPNAILETHRSASGAGLYSRLPMRKLPGSQFFFRQPRAALELPDGRSIRVVGVHPFPPGRGNDDVWQEALESLPTAGEGLPWILVGDFNATLDVSLMRETVARGYRDAGEVAGEGLVPTFPQDRHLIPPITIDHVLADERLGIVDYEVEALPGSDHRALYTELVWK
ncbi:MAG TPA: endonuclease/exonuclease/phosphatase family protein [Solirubrobacterales bacterium]|nr:endonuclease/exonuclease/phosphatase family protein [Solirubrobacterales bacterium]